MLRKREAASQDPLIQAFLAFLEAEAVAAASPVPPTQSNWLVQRAWRDGESEAFARIALFFDPETVQEEARMLAREAEKHQKQRKPLGDDPLKLA